VESSVDPNSSLNLPAPYFEQSLYSKYVWLRDYFYECLKLTQTFIDEDESVSKRHKRNVEEWKDKSDRL